MRTHASPAAQLNCAGRLLLLDRPRIMAVINVTPDSFSGDIKSTDPQALVDEAQRFVAEGADVLDIGGESTRPGATPVSVEEEIRRVIPAIEAIVASTQVPISVDTRKPEVMRAAAQAGAGMINDVSALTAPGALETVAEFGLCVCLMHMQADPQTMQLQPQYHDVVGEVYRFLAERVLACQFAGIDKKQIVIDPGFGFGKTLEHNLELLRNLDRFQQLGVPVLVGLSRKSMIGALIDKPVDQRVYGSISAALIAVQRGAKLLRVHDVAATRDALRMWHAVGAANSDASVARVDQNKARQTWMHTDE